MSAPLADLVGQLRRHRGVQLKHAIQGVASRLPAQTVAPWSWDPRAVIRNGDDAAAIPDADGYILLAAEGMLSAFIEQDPWFAGYCSVMVNVSDIVAMGGRPLAVVDVLFTREASDNDRLFLGMMEACEAFGVPVVGGHTSVVKGKTSLAVAIVGRARRLVTSFDAKPDMSLLVAIDLRGAYRGEHYFNTATHTAPAQLREELAVIPSLAEAGLVAAGKDISMAGLLGTAAMLCEASGCGLEIDLERIPTPADIPLERWLASFPSFGYLLAVPPAAVASVQTAFERVGVACLQAGQFQDSAAVWVRWRQERQLYWSLSEPVTGFGARPQDPRAFMPTLSGESSCPKSTSICNGLTDAKTAATPPHERS